MKVKLISLIAIIVLIVVVVIVYNCNRNTFTNITVFDQNVGKNEWDLVSSISPEDSLNILKVTYQEKYGMLRVIFCKVIFDNKKTAEYKCLSAEFGSVILQKSNLVSFKFEKVLK